MVEIIILVNDIAKEGFSFEHGFSAGIIFNNKYILFDTGLEKSLKINAGKLGVDISKYESLVISHGHYDHTGGIDFVLEANNNINIYAHPEFFRERYSIYPAKEPKNISIPEKIKFLLINKFKDNIIFTNDVKEIFPNVFLTGEIPRLTPFEDVGGPFYLDKYKDKKDDLIDDQAIWIDDEDGLVIITGCCHSGLINTINKVLKNSKFSHIKAIIGGFHLVNASIDRLNKTIEFLNKLDIEKLIPCHCTGDNAITTFKERLHCEVLDCKGGAFFSL